MQHDQSKAKIDFSLLTIQCRCFQVVDLWHEGENGAIIIAVKVWAKKDAHVVNAFSFYVFTDGIDPRVVLWVCAFVSVCVCLSVLLYCAACAEFS